MSSQRQLCVWALWLESVWWRANAKEFFWHAFCRIELSVHVNYKRADKFLVELPSPVLNYWVWFEEKPKLLLHFWSTSNVIGLFKMASLLSMRAIIWMWNAHTRKQCVRTVISCGDPRLKEPPSLRLLKKRSQAAPPFMPNLPSGPAVGR